MIGPLCAATAFLGWLLCPFLRPRGARRLFALVVVVAFGGFLASVWLAAPAAMDFRQF